MNVLIVGDYDTNRNLLRAMLRVDGFTPFEAADGIEALEILRTEPINVVVSEMLMPRMGGYRLCFEIRSNQQWKDIPLIVYTNPHLSLCDERIAIELGANKFVRKSASIAVLMDVIREVTDGGYRVPAQHLKAGEEVRVLNEHKQRLIDELEQRNLSLQTNTELLSATQEQLQLHSTALENAANAILVTDPKGTILWVNPAFTNVTGYSSAEAIGNNPRLLKSGRHDTAFYKQLWGTILSGNTWRGDFINRRKDGSVFFGEHTISPVRSKSGTVTHFVGIMNDVTKRKQAEQELRVAHDQLQRLLEYSPAVLYTLSVEGETQTPVLVGANIERLLGVPQAVAKDYQWWLTSLHPDDRDRVLEIVAKGMQGQGYSTEYRIRHNDGSYRCVEDNNRVVRDSTGQIIQAVGAWTDITQRKKFENELAVHEQRLNSFFTGATAGLGHIDQDLRYLQVNQTLADMNGVPAAQHVGKTVREVVPTLADAIEPHIHEVLCTGKTVLNFELGGETPHQPGVGRNWVCSMFPISGNDGGVGSVGVIVVEVTEQKRVERALRENELRFRQLAENISEVFWMTNVAKDKLLYVSPAYEVIWGQTVQSLYDSPWQWAEAIHPADRARVLRAAANEQMDGRYNQEYRIRRPDGSVRWIHDQAYAVQDEAGTIYRIAGIAKDITQAKLGQQRLAAQYAATRALAEGAPVDRTLLKVLQALCVNLGWEVGALWMLEKGAATLKCVEMWTHPSTEFNEFKALTGMMTLGRGVGLPGQAWAEDKMIWLADVPAGTNLPRGEAASRAGLRSALALPVRSHNQLIGVLELVSRDTRQPEPELLQMLELLAQQVAQFLERADLEQQFRQAQKMEAIGQLAGGVAHDFNNILTVINGHATILQMDEKLQPEVNESLQQISIAADRAANLTRQLLMFSRKQVLQPRQLDFNQVVTDMKKMLPRMIGEQISFDWRICPQPLWTKADAGMLEQVLMNLAVNARDAMAKGGQITIETCAHKVDEEEKLQNVEASRGDFVCLRVTDSGCGIPAGNLPRIFEPFFTTKAPGKGTGLGLATVYGIVRQHGGWVNVISEVGKGSAFEIFLPMDGEAAAQSSSAEIVKGPDSGNEAILLVEDEAPVRKLAASVLKRRGYQVFEAACGPDAIELWNAHKDDIRLLLTDMVMPAGMTGRELAKKLESERPGLKVIYTSGYNPDNTETSFIPREGLNYLAKPYQATQMLHLVRAALDGNNGN
jgi:two-component system, cell cycle sensor histidine kinase and response regulator CckA